MEKERKFKIGDGVLTIAGPMRDIYGTVVYFDEDSSQYLVRFTEKQQLYYLEEQMTLWDK